MIFYKYIAGCGGDIVLGEGGTQTLTTPNYPSNYATGAQCIWYIKVTL